MARPLNYQGPEGAHLAYVTKFSQTRNEDDRKGEGIHPGRKKYGKNYNPKKREGENA